MSSDETVYVKLKTRHCSADTYDTTIVSFSKVLHANKKPKKCAYFVFGFYVDDNPQDYRFWRFERQQARWFECSDEWDVSHMTIPTS